jgi:hypothetical protein
MATAHDHSSNKAHPHQKAHLHAKDQQEAKRPRPQAEVEPLQLIITMAPSNSSVLKIEKMDSSGKHHKLAKEEVATLVGKDDLHEIEAALDEAFEAGILSVLDPDSDGETDNETGEETELRRVLVSGIIGRGLRRRLQRRLVQRLILTRTLAH